MNHTLSVLIAMLAVFGFYSALCEIRAILWKIAKKKNTCAKNSPQPFDKEK